MASINKVSMKLDSIAQAFPHQLVLVTDLYGKMIKPLSNLRRPKHGLSELVSS
jgi:hypothetical protein